MLEKGFLSLIFFPKDSKLLEFWNDFALSAYHWKVSVTILWLLLDTGTTLLSIYFPLFLREGDSEVIIYHRRRRKLES